MKLKFKQIVSSVAPFRELSESKFPPRTSLDIYKLGKELDKELSAYQELSKKIYVLHKVPSDDVGNYDLKKLKQEDLEKFFKDLEELLELEVEIGDYSLDIATFERFNIAISPAMLTVLDWLIDVGEEEKVEEPVAEPEPSKAKTAQKGK